MSAPVGNVTCPGCREPVGGMAQVRGEYTFTVGEEADVLCFGCGETFVVTLTVFGWVSRPMTAAEREKATRDGLFNQVRTYYAEYREKNPEVWTEGDAPR